MSITGQLQRQGRLLFQRRNFLPLLLVPPTLVAIVQSGVLEATFGDRIDEGWMAFCLLVALAGQAIRAFTVGYAPSGTSGRNTADQRAAVLNTTGAYSLTRNPLYLGNLVVLLGFALATEVWWMTIILVLAFALYYERIIFAEEAYLDEKFGAIFRDWAATTPALIPRFSAWRPSPLGFSLRTVLRREYNGLALVFVTLPAIDLLRDLIAEGKTLSVWLVEDRPWAILAMTGMAIFIVLRTLKRRTRLLQEPGR